MKNPLSIAGLTALFVSLMLTVAIRPLKAQNKDNRQSINKMSLEDVLRIAEKENFQVLMAESDIEITRSQYRQTNAAFLPRISLEETGISTNDPLSVFGFKLKQEAVTAADFNPDILNNPDPYENFNTKLQVQQPLFNPDQFLRRSAVKNQLNAAKEQLEGTQSYARFQVKETYYQLLLTEERLSVINTSLKAARENERQARDFYEQGMVSKADYLAAAVRVRDLESRQSEAENQRQSVQENLRFLLGMNEEVVIQPTDSLNMATASLGSLPANPDVSNSTLQALQYRVKAAEKMVSSSKLSFVPSINLFGSYEFNDDVLLGTQGENYMLGATLKWELFSGFSKVGKVMQSQAELKKAKVAYQSQSQKTRMEIKQARRSVKQAQKQFAFAEASVEQAAEDLRIRSDRYEQGMEKTSDLLSAEARYSQAQLQRLNAVYQHNISMATLELLFEQELPN
ncbi:MAG: TolC family protein [Gracilimonas sp.]|uniref:TolC family protein n=1 Tax=Gracilimonas TaxID=649462 RepID=UPI001B2464B1|nr:TolC family protein [Gracilimonas sp.]MBO6585524.1 TolC family protein [Gracilimonas sp.]MBO6616521.1 TolC family protein [Gracilimonas sp.]